MIAALFSLLFLVSPFIFLSLTSELFEFNKIIFVYAITILITAAWIFRCVRESKIIFRRTILDIPLVLFLVSQVISTLLSIDPITSIYGYYSRFNGGLLSTVCYLLLYWAYVSNTDTKQTLKNLKIILFSDLIVSFWGILEHFGYSLSCLALTGQFNATCWVQDVSLRVFATLGQPNWLAALLVCIVPLSWYFLIISESKQKAVYFVTSAALFITILFTNSRSGLISIIIAFIIFWVFALRNNFKFVWKKFIALSIVYIGLAIIFGTPYTTPANNQQFTENAETYAESTDSGNIRLIVWKGAIDIVKNNPIFGTGVETFAYSYYKYRPIEHNLTSEWDYIYNKAHNEFINYAANSGLFGILTYLLIISVFLFAFLKELKKHHRISDLNSSLLAAFIGLNITSFFGFLTVNTSLMFFLIPAFYISLQDKKSAKFKKLNVKSIYKKTFLLSILLITIYLLFAIMRYWFADINYKLSRDAVSSEDFNLAEKRLSKAIDLMPFFANYHDLKAVSLAAKGLSEEALKELQITDALSPQNVNLLKSQANILIDLGQSDPKYLSLAIQILSDLLLLAPTDPSSYYILGLVLASNNQIDDSIYYFQKAVELKPDYTKAVEALEALRYNSEQ